MDNDLVRVGQVAVVAHFEITFWKLSERAQKATNYFNQVNWSPVQNFKSKFCKSEIVALNIGAILMFLTLKTLN